MGEHLRPAFVQVLHIAQHPLAATEEPLHARYRSGCSLLAEVCAATLDDFLAPFPDLLGNGPSGFHITCVPGHFRVSRLLCPCIIHAGA
jgi:hypothetical protein